jgi:hypothetical protein
MAVDMGRDTGAPRGQVLVIFAFAFAVIMMMLALVFDGAQGVAVRRNIQNATDAGALAGANILQAITPVGCSATPGPPPGSPQASVVAAVRASIIVNLPSYDPDDIVISCPAGWDNSEVLVSLRVNPPSFFAGVFGGEPLTVASRSGAVNGHMSGNAFSVIELDPSHLAWPNGRRGCPSFLLSGGPTARFDSAIYLNSGCMAADGGALSTNGNASSLTLGAGAAIRMVGQYKPQALTITPTPLQGQIPRADPLASLVEPAATTLTVRSPTKLTQNGGSILLQPGIYQGGIELKSSAKAYLRPGIYVMNGGGLQLGAQSELYSISAASTSATSANWGTKCPVASCGVLILNTGTATGSDAMAQLRIAAGAIFKVRSYNPDLDTTAAKNESYRNLLIWQSASPIPTSSYGQPIVQLIGGGGVEMSGTLYAPSAKVMMGGSSGGSGGDSIDLTLQFISWNLELSGNSSFNFRYNATSFARPLDYGLVE